jgi:hypothetical protein
MVAGKHRIPANKRPDVITLDCYGHLMPGHEEDAVELLDGYLSRSMGGAEP